MAKYEETSMGAIFRNRVEEHGGKALVSYKNKEGVWKDISWNKINEMVIKQACFLSQGGYNRATRLRFSLLTGTSGGLPI